MLAVSPALFDQGSSYFTLRYLLEAFSGQTAVAIDNSLWVSITAAALGVAAGFPVAWLTSRTALPARGLISAGMWLVLLLPSWLQSLGWIRIVQLDGVMYRLGFDLPVVTHAILGPFGVVLVLGIRNVPFSYLAISSALAGMGQEFEDAARVHGASRLGAIRVLAPVIAPAILSAVAIVFAEDGEQPVAPLAASALPTGSGAGTPGDDWGQPAGGALPGRAPGVRDTH